MRNQGEKLSYRKKYKEEFVWETSLFWLHALLFMCVLCHFSRLLLPLPKWRTCLMTSKMIYIIVMGGILCDIMSKLSKIWKSLLQFNNSLLPSLRTWYYFRLCFSFSCSGYGVTLIKKSHTLNCPSLLRKILLKTKNWKLVVGHCDNWIYC